MLTEVINKYSQFHCPTWEELPSTPLRSNEVVEYITITLKDLFEEEEFITKTMIQNYMKRNLIPGVEGRKYEKIHIAHLIIITIYKQVMTLNELTKGFGSVLKRTEPHLAYNSFCESLEEALKTVFNDSLLQHQYALPEIQCRIDYTGIVATGLSFALKRLASLVITLQGIVRKED